MRMRDLFPSNFLSSPPTNCSSVPLHEIIIERELADPRPPSPTSPINTSCLYRCLPLSPSKKQIRILCVDPADGPEFETPVSGILEVIDLEADADFAALSYVWGVFDDPAKTIMCRVRQVETELKASVAVTPNCLDALLHLRKQKSGPLRIWIDAICIDQKSEVELRHQLPLMSDIYSRAQTVFAWLGTGTPETDAAMRYLSTGPLPSPYCLRNRIQLPSGDHVPVVTGMSALFALVLASNRLFRAPKALSRASPYHEGLSQILTRPWIDRVWTLQEAVLANSLVVVCGKEKIPWLSVVFGVETLDLSGERYNELVPPRGLHPWRRLIEIWKTYHWKTSGGEGEGQNQDGPSGLKRRLVAHTAACKRAAILSDRLWLSIYLFYFAVVCFSLLAVILCLAALIVCPRDDVVCRLKYKDRIIILATAASLLIFIFTTVYIEGSGPRVNRDDDSPAFSFQVRSPSDLLLLELRERRATVERDKYFGVYNIFRPHHRDQGSRRRMPDYSHTTLDVLYRLLFKDVVRHTKSLDALLYTPARMGREPSWVVDWGKRSAIGLSSINSMHYKNFPSLYGGSLMQTQCPRGATPGSKSFWRFVTDRQLWVRGRIVSYITVSCGSLANMSARQNEASGYDLCRAAYIVTIRDPPLTFHEKRILLAMLFDPSDGIQDSLLFTWCVNMIGDLDWKPNILDRFIAGGCIPEYGILCQRLVEEQHTLVRAESETLLQIGYAPQDTMPGDAVVLISGVSLPMILRRTDTSNPDRPQYEVVGPAWFPRLVGGTTWESFGDDDLQDLVLV